MAYDSESSRKTRGSRRMTRCLPRMSRISGGGQARALAFPEWIPPRRQREEGVAGRARSQSPIFVGLRDSNNLKGSAESASSLITGAVYSLVPGEVLSRLGITPYSARHSGLLTVR